MNNSYEMLTKLLSNDNLECIKIRNKYMIFYSNYIDSIENNKDIILNNIFIANLSKFADSEEEAWKKAYEGLTCS